MRPHDTGDGRPRVRRPERTGPGPLPDDPGWSERAAQVVAAVRADPGRAATVAGVGVAVLVGAALVLRGPAPPPVEQTLPVVETAATTTTAAPDHVVVHVAGAVAAPGVHRLAPGARVVDAVAAAGGPAPDADLDRLNLAAVVHDGQRVHVPRAGEPVVAVDGDAGGSGEEPTGGPVDLNTATQRQLEALPGVGPATAQAILAERDRRGGFRSVDELIEVRGIGPAKLEALRDLVRV